MRVSWSLIAHMVVVVETRKTNKAKVKLVGAPMLYNSSVGCLWRLEGFVDEFIELWFGVNY